MEFTKEQIFELTSKHLEKEYRFNLQSYKK